LLRRLRSDNFQLTNGYLQDGGRRLQLRSTALWNSVEEVASLPVNGEGLQLKDVADVRLAVPTVNWHQRVDGRQGLSIGVRKEALANTVELSEKLRATIDRRLLTQPELADFQFKILFDQGKIIRESLTNLRRTALWGGLFALIIIYLFLRRLSLTLLITLSIPFAVFMALAVLYFLDWSLNIVTMMGLMISVGMVVDCAIVVVESIFVYRQEGSGAREAALHGASEVGLAVTMSTLTTIVVFAPIIFLGTDPMVGFWLKRIGVPVMVSLLASLLASLLFIPLLTVRFAGGKSMHQSRRISSLGEIAARTLRWVLKHRTASLLGVGILLATISFPLHRVPQSDSQGNINDFNLRVRLPAFYTLEDKKSATQMISVPMP
jgi:HAE1 family hydrophobic/amphiphilic exporter-1